MINLVVSTTTQSLHLANWASYPQAERASDTRLSHFLSTTELKKIFIEWIWLGKILANGVQFAKVFPRQNFALYGTYSFYRSYLFFCVGYTISVSFIEFLRKFCVHDEIVDKVLL